MTHLCLPGHPQPPGIRNLKPEGQHPAPQEASHRHDGVPPQGPGGGGLCGGRYSLRVQGTSLVWVCGQVSIHVSRV